MSGNDRKAPNGPGVTRHGFPERTFSTGYAYEILFSFSAVDAPTNGKSETCHRGAGLLPCGLRGGCRRYRFGGGLPPQLRVDRVESIGDPLEQELTGGDWFRHDQEPEPFETAVAIMSVPTAPTT